MTLALTITIPANAQNGAVTIPVPQASGPVPVTAESHPFLSAMVSVPPVDLAARGYVEEEFFVSGTGNVYDWETDGSIKIRTSGLPYTTRILVRKPANAAGFSGTVLVDIGNRADGFDTIAVWGQLNDHLLSNGHAYVAVTAFSGNIGSLKIFDNKRYAGLSFPKPSEKCGSGTPARDIYNRPAQFFPEAEDGIRWDVMSQVGALLKSKSPSNPLAGYNVQYVYASMQSGGDLPTYVSAIAKNVKLENGKPVYDAYLIKDSGAPGALNACSQRFAANDPRRIFRNVGVPVIQIHAQNAVAADIRRQDSDTPGDQFRRYELPGASHFDEVHFEYKPPVKDLMAAAVPMREYLAVPNECEPRVPINDFPQPYLFAGAFANLDQWVRKGTPPPKGQPIEVKEGQRGAVNFVNDDLGIVRGGVRTPWVDVPSGTFYPNMTGEGTCRNIGYWIPFSWPRLEAIYGSYANYSKKFLEAVDRTVKERWILPADGEKIKAEFRTKVSSN
jgi:hypothetical protein